MPKAETLLQLVGATPLVKLRRLPDPGHAEIWAKLEGFNPGGSVKDRAALAMIEEAEKNGQLRKGMTIVEPTSGNTGIGLALVAAVKGYPVVLTMSEAMSRERRLLLEAYGAELVLTPAEQGMKGTIDKAKALLASGNTFMPNQFENAANPEIHRRTTAREIMNDMGAAPVDAFVAGVGTGGTITGVGETLRSHYRGITVYAVEPASSPVLSEGRSGPHIIAGIGAGFVPPILNTKVYDEVITVSNSQAADMTKRLAREEGILAGISSGAVCWASLQVAARLGAGKRVVTLFPDGGERYLTTGVFERDP